MKILRNMLLACLLTMPLVAIAGQVVNINTAGSEALVDDLVGIGPQKASAIVRYRQQHGPFKHIDELALVNVVGPRTVVQNRTRMSVAAPKAGQKP